MAPCINFGCPNRLLARVKIGRRGGREIQDQIGCDRIKLLITDRVGLLHSLPEVMRRRRCIPHSPNNGKHITCAGEVHHFGPDNAPPRGRIRRARACWCYGKACFDVRDIGNQPTGRRLGAKRRFLVGQVENIKRLDIHPAIVRPVNLADVVIRGRGVG